MKCVDSDTYWYNVFHVRKSVIYLILLSDDCSICILKSLNNTTLLYHEKQLKLSAKASVNLLTLSQGGVYAVTTSNIIPFYFIHSHICSTSGAGGCCSIRTVMSRRIKKPTSPPRERQRPVGEYDGATVFTLPLPRLVYFHEIDVVISIHDNYKFIMACT